MYGDHELAPGAAEQFRHDPGDIFIGEIFEYVHTMDSPGMRPWRSAVGEHGQGDIFCIIIIPKGRLSRITSKTESRRC